jgi:Asp/Glu/hydantoin racemase
MNRILGIIHTTPVTLGPLDELAKLHLPQFHVNSLMDNSILPQLANNGGKVADVLPRLIQYIMNYEALGVEAILIACSSIGEIVHVLSQEVKIPVIRIDEAMAEAAIQRGNRVGVLATLSTTLRPTLQQLRDKAEQAGKLVEFEAVLADEAYRMLMEGKPEAHDDILIKALNELAGRSDIIVLAQASMARVAKLLPEAVQAKCITSPELGMLHVKKIVEKKGNNVKCVEGSS